MASGPEIVARRGPPGRLGGLTLAGRVAGARGAPAGTTQRFGSFGLTYLFGGAGRYRDATHDVALGPGSLVLVAPGHPHWYGAVPGGSWDEVILVFDGPLFRLARESGALDITRPVRRLTPVAHWLARIDRFRTRPAARTATGRDAEACDVLGLLVEIDAASGVAGATTPPRRATADWFDASVARLDADLDGHLSLPDVAASVGMPYETWRRRFRERAGEAPAAYRRARRVDAALALLVDTSLSTREIAVALGFSDEHHLIRHVRARTGRTPRQYRDERR